MESAMFELDVLKDGRTVVITMKALPHYCCAECIGKFMADFFKSMKDQATKSEKDGLH